MAWSSTVLGTHPPDLVHAGTLPDGEGGLNWTGAPSSLPRGEGVLPEICLDPVQAETLLG